MSVLDYTGPITKVIFTNGNPQQDFGLTFHTNAEDILSIENIIARYKEDGFRPVRVIKEYSVGGVIEPREPKLGPAGFRARSAFLRA